MEETLSCKNLFVESLDSLNPENLLRYCLTVNKQSGNLILNQENRTFSLANGYYIVGFGKAVLGLTATILDMLGDLHLKGGILSIPVGTSDLKTSQPWLRTCQSRNIKVFEGAHNNLPDHNSENAAKEVVKMVSDLKSEDVVIVVISGGGSSLLPLTVSGISLEDKLEVIKLLSRAGADITELNMVRKTLSQVKGGKLAKIMFPAQVVSFIVSDIVGDPLDMIASGPTVLSDDCSHEAALKILEKYDLTRAVAMNVRTLLSDPLTDVFVGGSNNVDVVNILIGNNEIPLKYIQNQASSSAESIILTRDLVGEAREIGSLFSRLVKSICLEDGTGLESHLQSLDSINVEDISRIVNSISESNRPLVLIAGGETTVKVIGEGKGGRNQEVVLSFATNMSNKQEMLRDSGYFIEFLSCGTDGIDGPTDAAGAVWNTLQSIDCLDAQHSLGKNDSYSFWRKIPNSLVMTGHTGTNVADILICVIKKPPKKSLD